MFEATKKFAVALAVGGLCGALAMGCGDDDGGGSDPMEHEGPPHTLMRIGSTAAGGGALDVNESPVAYVVESACLGGTGDECTGGTVLYSGSSPGFNDLDADDPAQPLYILPEGVDVYVEVTAVDPGASLLISGVLLDEAGEMALVNESGHLHNHPAWQITEDGGVHPEDREIAIRLHADGFASSDEITVTLSHFEGDGHTGHEHNH